MFATVLYSIKRGQVDKHPRAFLKKGGRDGKGWEGKGGKGRDGKGRDK